MNMKSRVALSVVARVIPTINARWQWLIYVQITALHKIRFYQFIESGFEYA